MMHVHLNYVYLNRLSKGQINESEHIISISLHLLCLFNGSEKKKSHLPKADP